MVLNSELLNSKELRALLTRLDAGSVTLVSGTDAVHKAHLAAALNAVTERVVVVVAPNETDAARLTADVSSLSGEAACLLNAREFTFYEAEIVSRETEHERISTLYKLLSADGTQRGSRIFVTTPDALMQRTMPPDVLLNAAFVLTQGDKVAPDALVTRLVECGYEYTEQVEGVGQFARRGGIIDFFSPALDMPVRAEFWGDEVDALGIFEPSIQRRTMNITSAVVLPSAECLTSLHQHGETGLLVALQELYESVRKRKKTKKSAAVLAASQTATEIASKAQTALLARIEADFEKINSGSMLQAVDRYMALIYEELKTAADYLPPNAIVLMCEPSRLAERAKNYLWRISEDVTALLEGGVVSGELARYAQEWDEITRKLPRGKKSVVMTDSFRAGQYPLNPRITLTLTAKQLPGYGGSLTTAADDIKRYMEERYRVAVLCADEDKAREMQTFLSEQGVSATLDFKLSELPGKGRCIVGVGSLSAGMEYPQMELAIITEGQLFSRASGVKKRSGSGDATASGSTRKGKFAKNRQKLQSYSDLSPGDLVVHEAHGIGRFLGMVQIEVDETRKEYIQIAFRGTDKVYVPATQLDTVSKYIGTGGDNETLKLSKLGGTDWAKAKSRAKAAAKNLAEGLIALYAERAKRSGYAFSKDSGMQREFEDAFPYAETNDQLRCIEEIKHDMEKPLPMDRLLCGDVGFGKTEVALRAVMKCITDNKQTAILVPTTVLAQQHYVTASQRFSNIGINIEVLSRFRSSSEINRSLKAIKAGKVDLVIGTHRLLSKDIEFKNLGLLIVDEEQRFGVSHKEKLKRLSSQVDVLTLSATPIPRTLNMALAGIRDMSSIEEPPTGRHPVQTYVLEHDWSVLTDAIRRETGRGGQVYYLHNRIESIDRTAYRIREMLGDNTPVATAHGGMSEQELSDVMERVSSGEVKVLVCTTIIETGIDIPNVNTLIIEDADRLGLAQLHQIRGRVGRSNRYAWAYFTFRQGKVLSENAMKRLNTIREFAAFNSGVKIALRDLEIRGAGNLLGAEQSGHMQSVGYDMYLKLLEEAVIEQKGDKVKRKPACSADLTVSASIPDSYISSQEQRMDFYRRIAFVETQEDADDMIDELSDRFGEPPKPVLELLRVALLRGEAASAGVTEISQKGGQMVFTFSDIDNTAMFELFAHPEYSKRLKVERSAVKPTFALRLVKGSDVIEECRQFVAAVAPAAPAAAAE